ncbi:MAG: hypothetical protein V9F01_00975 [Chitinophagaceae bacterium]
MFKISENYLKIVSSLSVSLIVLGNVYMYNYYQYFGINIYNYTDASELLYLFLPFLIKVYFVVFLLLIYFYLFTLNYVKKFERNLIRSRNKFAALRKVVSNLDRLLTIVFICSFVLYLILDNIYRVFNLDGELLDGSLKFGSFVSFLIGMVAAISKIIFKIKKRILLLKPYVIIMSISISFILLLNLSSFHAFIDSNSNSNPKKYVFKFKEETLVTNDSLKYIGSTNSNLFFLTMLKDFSKTEIYRKEDLMAPILIEYKRSISIWGIR